MRNIFLENLCTKYGEETISRPFSKKSKGVYRWINSLKSHTICFYYMQSCGLLKDFETKLQTTCFYLI